MVLRVLRDYPTEVESDLLDKGLEIGDWYQQTRDDHGRLKLSSRRLLDVVLPNLPEVSAFNDALREGDWPESTQILAKIHEEIAGDNASKREEREFMVFLSPKDRLARYIEEHEESLARQDDEEMFYSDMGFS
jgi:hypothetical protein